MRSSIRSSLSLMISTSRRFRRLFFISSFFFCSISSKSDTKSLKQHRKTPLRIQPSYYHCCFLVFDLTTAVYWMCSKSNNQIDLDQDRFVGRDQSDQTKKNAFNTGAKSKKKREIRDITRSVQKACREVPHKICSFWQQKWGKNYICYKSVYFKNLAFVCHAADGRGNWSLTSHVKCIMGVAY